MTVAASIPPRVLGIPRGWLRVQLNIETDYETPPESERRTFLGIRWWGSNFEDDMYVETHPSGCDADVIVPSVIRTSRSKFVDWLRDAPRRQALEIMCMIEPRHGRKRTWSGYVPLASLIERLSSDKVNSVSCRDIRVGLRERSVSGESPKSPLGAADMNIMCNIDVSFDPGDRIASERVCESADQVAVDRLAELSISSRGGGDRLEEHCSVVLGQDSLDELGSEPGWPLHARRMDVYVVSARFDQSYAPLHVDDDARVYLTLGMSKDGRDQQETTTVAFHRSPASEGHYPKMMEAQWNDSEVVSFDPMNSSGASPMFTERASSDSHASQQSGASLLSRRSSQSPVNPILKVGLWKSVKILDQFHNFAGSAMSHLHGDTAASHPYDELIGSAVVVPTGALSQEEGVEIPLYTSDLRKSGTVHLKIVTNTADDGLLASVDETSSLNYELLRSMDALARHVLPDRDEKVESSEGKIRYAMSHSDDSDGAFVGLAYEGAVSCSDDEGPQACPTPEPLAPVERKHPCILSDDWVFNIEKSAC